MCFIVGKPTLSVSAERKQTKDNPTARSYEVRLQIAVVCTEL